MKGFVPTTQGSQVEIKTDLITCLSEICLTVWSVLALRLPTKNIQVKIIIVKIPHKQAAALNLTDDSFTENFATVYKFRIVEKMPKETKRALHTAC